jgi:hypothetical protein
VGSIRSIGHWRAVVVRRTLPSTDLVSVEAGILH